MRILHNRRGISLVEAIVTMFIATLAALVFAASLPTATKCARQAHEYKTANAIAQEKMEELRSMKYELLTPTLLHDEGVIDGGSISPYSFTTVEEVPNKLTQGTGTLRITDIASDVKRVTITVSWLSPQHAETRRVKITSYIADRRTRKAI